MSGVRAGPPILPERTQFREEVDSRTSVGVYGTIALSFQTYSPWHDRPSYSPSQLLYHVSPVAVSNRTLSERTNRPATGGSSEVSPPASATAGTRLLAFQTYSPWHDRPSYSPSQLLYHVSPVAVSNRTSSERTNRPSTGGFGEAGPTVCATTLCVPASQPITSAMLMSVCALHLGCMQRL